jgi:predicted RNase H-like HicB family nuclease
MMLYRLAVEDIEPNHWVAWVLDLPGCFSSAQTEAEAVAQAPERILTYYAWLSSHDPSLPVVKGLPAVTVVDRFRAYTSPADPDYLVNAFSPPPDLLGGCRSAALIILDPPGFAKDDALHPLKPAGRFGRRSTETHGRGGKLVL